MFDALTYAFDRIRIRFGDSTCPLSGKCPGYDAESNPCASYRGRTEIRGERAECYSMFKPQIRLQKDGLIGKVAEGFMKAEGIVDEFEDNRGNRRKDFTTRVPDSLP